MKIMKWCKDCQFYEDKQCVVFEYNVVTGEKTGSKVRKEANLMRMYETHKSCGLSAKFFKAKNNNREFKTAPTQDVLESPEAEKEIKTVKRGRPRLKK